MNGRGGGEAIRTRQAEAPAAWRNMRGVQSDGGRWALLPLGCGPLEFLVADWGATAAKLVDAGERQADVGTAWGPDAAPAAAGMRVMARMDNGRWYRVEVRGPAGIFGREILCPPVAEGIEAAEDEAELASLLWAHRAAERAVFEARRVLAAAEGTMDAIGEAVDEWRAAHWRHLQAR